MSCRRAVSGEREKVADRQTDNKRTHRDSVRTHGSMCKNKVGYSVIPALKNMTGIARDE